MIRIWRDILHLLLLFVLFQGCSTSENPMEKNKQKIHAHGEYINRLHDEYFFIAPPPERQNPEAYPWEKHSIGNYPQLTKEYFRCKGSPQNPMYVLKQKDENKPYLDCGGVQKHSLPLRDGKEFIYPVLIDILNYIQIKTGKKVVITSGHRCPEHNAYVDPSPTNQYSKHMIGAEAAFYVQEMEERPEFIVKLIQNYYLETPKYKGLKEFEEFKRYDKEDVDVSTRPWFNKEIYLKIYKKTEGRNFDNRHPYPYMAIQVRYDFDQKEKVVYSWEKANKNYLRK